MIKDLNEKREKRQIEARYIGIGNLFEERDDYDVFEEELQIEEDLNEFLNGFNDFNEEVK